MEWKEIVFDIEADNLLPFISKIWVVVVLDRQTKQTRSFTDRESFVNFINTAKPEIMIGHSILGYDLLALRKVWQIPFTVGRQDTFNELPVEFVDTFLLSMYLNPDRQGHGLEPFGERLGFRKVEFEDFSEYSEMQEAYCENDVRLTDKVYDYLMREVEAYVFE